MSAPLSIVADQQIIFAREAFSRFGSVRLIDGRLIDAEAIKHADVLLVRSVTRVNETLLSGSAVRFIGSATSGTDHIDHDYLAATSINFVHAPGSNARSVAEYVLSGLFAVAQQWVSSLPEKTVGIVGHGHVGKKIAKFFESMGMEILLNDPLLALQSNDYHYVDFNEIAKADIITLHVPLTSCGDYPTKAMVNSQFLAKLKPDIVLINTSRGEVIDEVALTAFKKQNKIATLILDVWCHEPVIDLTLLQATQIATPHIAGYSLDGKREATRVLAAALAKWIGFDKGALDLGVPKLQMAPLHFYSGQDHITQAVMRSYDIRKDAIKPSELIDLKTVERGIYFDNLRKNYPIRREFTHRIINGHGIADEKKQKLMQLGFVVE